MAADPGELSALARLIREGSDEDVKRFFLLLRPPELADCLEQLPDEDRTRAVRLMAAPLAAEVLREVEESEREDILEILRSAEIAPILSESMSDDAADILGLLPPDKAERTLGKLDEDEREELEELLEYGEDTAGGIMQTEVVKVRSDLDVAQAIEAVRAADVGDVGEIHEVFVVDSAGRLVGTVSPADLLQEKPKASLRAIIEPNPVHVPVSMDQEQIAHVVRENDLAAVPVVDAAGVLVGQILHDDVADVLQEEATEDIAKMAGTDPDEVYGDNVVRTVLGRIGWLLPAFVGGLLVAIFMGAASEEIKRRPILAAFIVVVVGMAGGVGIQNTAVTVRMLALGRLEHARLRTVVFRQLVVAVSLGLVFGLLLAGFTLVYEKDEADAGLSSITLGVAICVTIAIGGLLGVVVPLLLDRLGADPAIAASPFIQTANDVVGAGILFWTARVLGLL